ncbi:MAG: hypothetical protein ACLPSF_15120 [Methylocella sp.]
MRLKSSGRSGSDHALKQIYKKAPPVVQAIGFAEAGSRCPGAALEITMILD